MSKPLKVLIVEDSEDDATLITRELNKGGFDSDVTRIQTAEGMKKALEDKKWDIILSDYRMPGFSGLQALEILKKTGLDIPFILISGTVGEQLVVEAMKAGACDYVMKDKLDRLDVAMERELREAEIRHEKKQAEIALIESEKKYKFLIDKMNEMALILDKTGTILFANRSSLETLGYSEDEVIGKSMAGFLAKGSLKKALWALAQEFLGIHHGAF